jgi:hypothetical protein
MGGPMKLLTVLSSTPHITNNPLHHPLSNKMHLAISVIQGMSTKRTITMKMVKNGTTPVTYSLGNKLTAMKITVRSINFKQTQHTQSLKSKIVKEE